jgi:hypothetical protein
MRRATRWHKLVRILILIGAALVWMGPPRPPAPPGCRGPVPPRPPMPYHEMHDAPSPAANGAAIESALPAADR